MKLLFLTIVMSMSLMATNDIKILKSKELEITGKNIRFGIVCVDGVKFVFASRYAESAALTQIMKNSEGLGVKPVACK